MRHVGVAFFGFVVACGGEIEASGVDASTDGAADAPIVDASADEREARAYPDAAPDGCADLGRYPGFATCCGGQYCQGACEKSADGGTVCSCGGILGGCPWPAACCHGACVGPASDLCKDLRP